MELGSYIESLRTSRFIRGSRCTVQQLVREARMSNSTYYKVKNGTATDISHYLRVFDTIMQRIPDESVRAQLDHEFMEKRRR